MRVLLLFLFAVLAYASAISISAGAALRPGAVAAGGSIDLLGGPGNRPPFFDRPGRPGGRPPWGRPPRPPFGRPPPPPFVWPGYPFYPPLPWFTTTTTASPSTSTTSSTSTTNSATTASASSTSSGSTTSTTTQATTSSSGEVTQRMGGDQVVRAARDIHGISDLLRQSSGSGFPFIPNIDDFISNILNSSNSEPHKNYNSSSNPRNPLQLPQLPSFPIISQAVQYARNHLLTALGGGADLTSGLNRAMNDAFNSQDPEAATRTLLRTVVDAYVTVAVNCPIFIIGSAIIQEGTQIAMEIARRLANISIEGGISVSV